MTVSSNAEPKNLVSALIRGYALLILVLLGLAPFLAIAYLYFFQDPALRFEHYGIHEIAIGFSLLQGGFIAYVTYRCYLHSGEAFLRWLTLGFMGFTVVYAWHGVFTRVAPEYFMLFILYGPASRLVMAACLLAGLMVQGRHDQDTTQTRSRYFWLGWLVAFAILDLLVYLLASSEWASLSRWVMEISAIILMLGCVLTIMLRRIRSPLMTLYILSVMFFTQSSFAFLLGPAWAHMWWLAHAIFATGFIALSYGVIQAFLTTGSFIRVYSQAELIEQVRVEKARTDDALVKLQHANADLEIIAATDSLTGSANRRDFEAQAMAEVARSKRSGAPLSFVSIDLDHFKQVNDRHGHKAGDEVLRAFVALVKKTLRPSDLIGRLGGEEFALMLPDTAQASAAITAERIRQLIGNEVVMLDDIHLRFTASLGVAQYGSDGDTYESVIEAADDRMYLAKRQGRNQVASKEGCV